ncbi:hypothetical protein [Novosphingopyxis sp.]|uniref:hypothetical protein n=1 Tax=Novosphingopyxis sp. TaxID=2709690 RepID=UPI003B5BFA3D
MFHERDSFRNGLQGRDWAVRVEFCALIDELEAIRAERDPVYFLIKLTQLRTEARHCRLGALVAVAEKCEQALTRAIHANNVSHFERDYAMLMRDAVDCGDVSAAQSEALLASVAYRMTG